MTTDGYYRYPTIYNNEIVFVSEDDLWSVPAEGGLARRLTANLGPVSRPAFSPDGQWLAFEGREDGETEVYVMAATGGPARRLTYLGCTVIVLGWTPQGDIVFASDTGQPFPHLTMVYTINPHTGGEPTLLPFGPARAISFGEEKGVVIGRRSQDLARWKRYRGGTAGDIWIDVKGKGNFKPLLSLESNLARPLWLDDRIYFLSDHEGVGNIYSCTVRGTRLKRHTHHADYYVREQTGDGQRIVYRAGADLYLFDPTTSGKKAIQKIPIEFRSPQVQRNRKFTKAPAYLEYYTLHPNGHSLAVTVRGKPVTMFNWEGAALQHGEPHGVRYRLPEWLNDGKRLLLVSDAKGEETLEIHTDAAQTPPSERVVERLEGLDIGRPLSLVVSPKNDLVVFGNHRYELMLVDLAGKKARVLDRSDHGRIVSIDWSPDGRWVAYSFRTSRHTSAIKLCHLESGQTHYVTAPQTFVDFGPSFDPEGKYLYFISYRDFDPVYDSLYFDLNFPWGSRPYLVTLQASQPNPFVALPKQMANGHNGDKDKDKEDDKNNGDDDSAKVTAAAEGKPSTPDKPIDESGQDESNDQSKESKESDENQESKKKEKNGKNGEPAKLLQIDLEGIQQRVAAFPVADGRYRQVRGIKGKVLFVSFPVEGSLGNSWSKKSKEPGKGALEMYDLAERKKEFVVSGINAFSLSRKRNFVIYRSGKNLRVFKAGEKPDNNANGFNKKSGWLKLARIRVAINPLDEWQQMFREAWRLQRDHFWSEDMAQIDWQAVYQRYFPLIERVGSRAEFSDLLWEMQGELGTSHAYEIGGDYRPSPRYLQGFLGADFVYDADNDGYRITHIVRGDPWMDKSTSPLMRLGANVKVGDLLLAIDGQQLGANLSPRQALINRVNTEVQLTLRSPNGNGEATSETDSGTVRLALVETLAGERKARYREWVEHNRQWVHDQTNGQVGYVHIPDMGPYGYAEFHRYYLSEADRAGLIIDVRFNGGGHVSQLLLEKLTRRRIGYSQSRYGVAGPYPRHSVLGPMVALTNEHAGSDGDIFSHAFKLLNLGPLIGKRTWGGVIGIRPSHSLVDGTITTQPEFSFWFEDVGWQVENYGTDPDIEVEFKPQDYAKGKDPQLTQAITEVQRLLAENPPAIPDFGARPSRAVPSLPPLKKKRKK